MPERLSCSNCGAPITRAGTETRGTCTHCQHVTEFPAVESAHSRNRDHDDDDDASNGHGHIPQIVIIQGGPTVVRSEPTVVVSGGGSSIVSWIIYAVIFFSFSGGIGGYVRHRTAAARAASAPVGAENDAEKAQKAAADKAVAEAKAAAEKAAAEAKEAAEKAAKPPEKVPERVPEKAPQKGPPPKHH